MSLFKNQVGFIGRGRQAFRLGEVSNIFEPLLRTSKYTPPPPPTEIMKQFATKSFFLSFRQVSGNVFNFSVFKACCNFPIILTSF